jgi:hypothetical protein
MQRVTDPRLALLLSLEYAREDRVVESLAQTVKNHAFSQEELESIKPELYELARASGKVREKLIEMKFDGPDFAPERIGVLGNTNLFTLVPTGR